jgi:hypothetical protein
MDGDRAELFTINDVGDACGLPGPVLAQLVLRRRPADFVMAIRPSHRFRRPVAALPELDAGRI